MKDPNNDIIDVAATLRTAVEINDTEDDYNADYR